MPRHFSPLSLSDLEQICPRALVEFDQHIGSEFSDAVFLKGNWFGVYNGQDVPTGFIYAARLGNSEQIWCWNAYGGTWDDISGGHWAPGLERDFDAVLAEIRAQGER